MWYIPLLSFVLMAWVIIDARTTTKEHSLTRAFGIVALLGLMACSHSDPKEAANKCTQLSGDQAIKYCRKVLEQDPTNFEAGRKFDGIMIELGRGREAIESYLEEIKKNPSDGTAHLHLCRVYSRMRQYDDGISECQKTLQLVPNSPVAYFYLGENFRGSGRNNDMAIEYYQKAIQYEPNNLDAHFGLSSVLSLAKRPDEALKEIDLVIQQSPADDKAYLIKAGILKEQDKTQEAIEPLKRALALNPKNDTALFLMGGLLQSLGRNQEALIVFGEAAKIKPNEPDYQHLLGLMQLMLGHKDDAATSFKNYLLLVSDDPEKIKQYATQLEKETGARVQIQVSDVAATQPASQSQTVQQEQAREEPRGDSRKGESILYNMFHDETDSPQASTSEQKSERSSDKSSEAIKAYLGGAGGYLKTQNEQGTIVAQTMANLNTGESALTDVREAIKRAQSVTNAGWYGDYLKLDEIVVPPDFLEIDKKIRHSHTLRESAFKEYLAYWKDQDPAHIVSGTATFRRSEELAQQATNDLTAAIKSLIKRQVLK